jgi:glycosyltransferase involved in cell wall biosynthesis
MSFDEQFESAGGRRGRWYCAIALEYAENGGFWDRDGALVSEGFRKLGVDSKFMAVGEPRVERDRPLILGSLAQMSDPAWWRQWDLDGILLYAWALPRFESIARAVKTAGVKLVLVLDTAGYVHPSAGVRTYYKEKYYAEREGEKFFAAGRALLKTLSALVPGRYAGMVRHLAHGDFLVLPSPLAQERYDHFLKSVKRPDLAQRLRSVPYAVTPDMFYTPAVQKQPIIIAVGRWQSFQKGTPILARVLTEVLATQPDYQCQIIGTGEECVRKLLQDVDEKIKSRIKILGRVPHEKLARHYQESQILLCTSYYESFHIAAGEALCCGASVVGDARISSMPYFCSATSGTVSPDLSVGNLSTALLAEMEAWRRGQRDPSQIGEVWVGRLHPERVAAGFLALT